MTIRLLPTPPKRTDDPVTFVSRADGLLSALPGFVDDANTLAAQLNTVAAGGAYALPYKFSSTTTDSDPGNGWLRLSSAVQNTSGVIRLDLTGLDNIDYTALIDTFDLSTSGIKGSIRLTKVGDVGKFIVFNVVSRATVAGYRNITVSPVVWSSANPFVDGDTVILHFQRAGDLGGAGSLNRRMVSVVSNAAPTPDISNTDCYEITTLAANLIVGAPVGVPQNGQTLLFRIKDNGVSRTVAFNPIYRASIELPFPAVTVVGKWLYCGFIFNAADTRWDCIASIGSM